MIENEVPKSKRDIALERLRAKYPDQTFDDDESVFGRIVDDYDQYDQNDRELGEMREREGKFSEMFTRDPRSARLMMAWKDGDDPVLVLLRLYGDDIKTALDDPAKQDAIAEANKEYMERVAKEKEYESDYSANLTASLQELEKAQEEYGLSDEEVDESMQWLINIAMDAMQGKFSAETIRLAFKGRHYDSDIEQAQAEAEVRGRNAKVTETLRKPQRGDGTARLDGKSGGGGSTPMPDLGAIDRYGDGTMNIFERGGERRIPIKR